MQFRADIGAKINRKCHVNEPCRAAFTFKTRRRPIVGISKGLQTTQFTRGAGGNGAATDLSAPGSGAVIAALAFSLSYRHVEDGSRAPNAINNGKGLQGETDEFYGGAPIRGGDSSNVRKEFVNKGISRSELAWQVLILFISAHPASN